MMIGWLSEDWNQSAIFISYTEDRWPTFGYTLTPPVVPVTEPTFDL